MLAQWQTRRSRFNHDWLKNQFLPALDKFLNILDDQIEDDETEANFVSDVLPEWERKSAEARSLAEDFEQEMSPRTLFRQPPLANCDEESKKWLSELTHELWLIRHPVREKIIAEALSRAEDADTAYLRLSKALSGCADTKHAVALRPLCSEFLRFRQSCYQLALAIEKFPSEVRL